MSHTLTVASLDVWGNEEDGFDINNAFYTDYTIEVDEYDSNHLIINKLISAEYLHDDVSGDDYIIEGEAEYGLYVFYADTHEPAFHLLHREG